MTQVSSSMLTMIQRSSSSIPSQSLTRTALALLWIWLLQRVRQAARTSTTVSAASTAAIPHQLNSATRSASTMYPAHPSAFPSLASQQLRQLSRTKGELRKVCRIHSHARGCTGICLFHIPDKACQRLA